MTEIWLLPESTALPNFIYFMGVWNTNEHVWLCNSLFWNTLSLQNFLATKRYATARMPHSTPVLSQGYVTGIPPAHKQFKSTKQEHLNVIWDEQGLTSRSKAQGDSENCLSFIAKVGAAKSNRMRIRRPSPLRFQVQSWQCNNISTVPCTKILS